jgi:anti-sigma factor RsiW
MDVSLPLSCDTAHSQLDAWLAGRLPAPVLEPLERHLTACLECRLDAEAARLVRAVLGRVPRKELLRAIREDRQAERP